MSPRGRISSRNKSPAAILFLNDIRREANMLLPQRNKSGDTRSNYFDRQRLLGRETLLRDTGSS